MAIILNFTSGLAAQDIFINQVGHRPQDRKDFRLNTAATSFEILDSTGTAVYNGDIFQQKNRDDGAREDVWIGDFSSFEAEGNYTIRLDDGRQSDTINIGGDLYNDIFKTAVRGLYTARCNYAVRDDSVGRNGLGHRNAGKFLYKVVNGEEQYIEDDRDVTGGWYNGGDYRRSTISAAQAINRMLNTLELFPEKFQQYTSTLQPGEGPAGWPDIVVESRWGLDWLVKMQDGAGGVSIGLGPTENTHPKRVTPEEDDTEYLIGTVDAANTGKAGAVLARAARVFQDYDTDLANSYLAKAVKAYNFLDEKGGVGGDTTVFTYRFNGGWRGDYLWLSLELYLTTENTQYHDKFIELYNEIKNDSNYDGTAFPAESPSTHTMRSENLQETLLRYCLVEDLPTNDDIKGEIWKEATEKLHPLVARWRNFGYGYVLDSAFWQHRHTVGNMLHKAWTLLTAYRVSEVMESFPFKGYREAALDQINIVLGRNTLNRTFVTGVGRRFVTDPHLRLTTLGGVPPGMPVKGPTFNRDSSDADAPAKNYVDNKGRHWFNEPDVEATGYFIAFTGYLASDGSDTSTPEPPKDSDRVTIRAQGDCGDEVMELRVDGSKVKEWTVSTSLNDYTYEGFLGGEVSVHFVNDRYRDGGECEDSNLTVDYLDVCGAKYETEERATETASCCVEESPEKLYTNGNFNFGNLSCSSATQASRVDQPGSTNVKQVGTLQVYPNPAREQIVVRGPEHYNATLYNLNGKIIRHQTQQSRSSQLDVATVPPGVYLLQVLDTHTQQTHQVKLILE